MTLREARAERVNVQAVCADSKMIECHNEVFLRARQIVVCPGCGGKGDRECPNCYGEGVNTAAA